MPPIPSRPATPLAAARSRSAFHVTVPTRAGAALINVEFAAEQLNATIARWANGVEAAALSGVIEIALSAVARIQMRTPVKTGRARNSVHAVLPGEHDAYAYTDNRGRGFDGTLSVSSGPLEAWVGSNVGYMPHLEAGSSRQAPQGMFAITFLELRGALEAAIQRRLTAGEGSRG